MVKGGGYWYLATRHEEYASSEDAQEEYTWLIPYALPVAERLKTEALGRTLLHGDVKGENILFSKASSQGGAQKEEKCALYDFQYVGSGLGVVDLVYFLGTTMDERDLRGNENEEALLRVYFEEVERGGRDGGVYMGGFNAAMGVGGGGLDEVYGGVGMLGEFGVG
ncbi:unnamed protein product [Tuber aestivum]|uniref:Aminoglycoside phosphotransferase domain-containing protein n=1 Tax=Tuber aestivum TaxID=59557 RepID=A0A292Q4F9_9PEZI|nr:unnamed protein product [Tuber aestivum]